MHHGKLSFLLIVNGYRHLVREFEDRLVPGHGEGDVWLPKYLNLYLIITRAQDSALESSNEDTSDFQE